MEAECSRRAPRREATAGTVIHGDTASSAASPAAAIAARSPRGPMTTRADGSLPRGGMELEFHAQLPGNTAISPSSRRSPEMPRRRGTNARDNVKRKSRGPTGVRGEPQGHGLAGLERAGGDPPVVRLHRELHAPALGRVVREQDPLRPPRLDAQGEAPLRSSGTDRPVRTRARETRSPGDSGRPRRRRACRAPRRTPRRRRPRRAAPPARLQRGRSASCAARRDGREQEEEQRDVGREPVRARQQSATRKPSTAAPRRPPRAGAPASRSAAHDSRASTNARASRQDEADGPRLRERLQVRVAGVVADPQPDGPPRRGGWAAATRTRPGPRPRPGAARRVARRSPEDRPRGRAVLDRQAAVEDLAQALRRRCPRPSETRSDRDAGEQDARRAARTAARPRARVPRATSSATMPIPATRTPLREPDRTRPAAMKASGDRGARPPRARVRAPRGRRDDGAEAAEDAERIGVDRSAGEPARQPSSTRSSRRGRCRGARRRPRPRTRRRRPATASRARSRSAATRRGAAGRRSRARGERGEARARSSRIAAASDSPSPLTARRPSPRDERPERARLHDGEHRRERPDDEQRPQRPIGARRIRRALEVVEEPEGPPRREPAKSRSTGQAMASAPPARRSPRPASGKRNAKTTSPRSRHAGRQQREPDARRQDRKAVPRGRRKADREDAEEPADRREQEQRGARRLPGAAPDGRSRRRPRARHPRWYSCSEATPVASSCRARIPSTAAVGRRQRRQARNRRAAAPPRGSRPRRSATRLPSGVLMTSWISPASIRSTALGLPSLTLKTRSAASPASAQRLARPLRRAEREAEVRELPRDRDERSPCRTD